MATVTSFSTLHSICSLSSTTTTRTSISSVTHLPQGRTCSAHGFKNLKFSTRTEKRRRTRNEILRSVEGESAVVTEQEEEQPQETVSVPVSPSDLLTMYIQADGTMSEAAIPTITKALEATEGISDLKVEVSEGIATVELKKQTTVQASGVASSLVEIIQGAGFKLQTLNLSFEDEEDILVRSL